MFDLAMTLLLCWVIGLVAYNLGSAEGKEEGRKEVHKKEWICMDLPNNKIHCYEAEGEKK